MSVGAVNKNTGERIPTAGMPAIDDALDLTSVNPVQNAVITAALALKQDKTDNALQTTDKTVVGGINELKSGLTTLNDEVLLKSHNTVMDTLSIVQEENYTNVNTNIFTAEQNTIINLYLEKDSNTSYRYYIVTRGSSTVYRFGSESSYGNIDKLICSIFVPKGETVKLITQTILASTTTVKYQLSY